MTPRPARVPAVPFVCAVTALVALAGLAAGAISCKTRDFNAQAGAKSKKESGDASSASDGARVVDPKDVVAVFPAAAKGRAVDLDRVAATRCLVAAPGESAPRAEDRATSERLAPGNGDGAKGNTGGTSGADGDGKALNLDWANFRGYTKFCWPLPEEDMRGNITRLAELMTEYSGLVGTCLHRDTKGAGEAAWGACRADFSKAYYTAMRDQGAAAYCEQVVHKLVNTVYLGSQYCQYGNCGEGSHVGACLAMRAGLPKDWVGRCSSAHDHTFAIFKTSSAGWVGPGDEFCVLDRWNLIGRGHAWCGAVLTRDQQLGVRQPDGSYRTTGKQWYTNLTCQTVDDAEARGWVN